MNNIKKLFSLLCLCPLLAGAQKYVGGDISLLPTGIDNTTAPDFHLTHDGNTLTLQGCRLQWVKLFDTNGRLLKHFPAAAQNQASLSIADLAPGIYLVQTAADGHIRVRRFVKQ